VVSAAVVVSEKSSFQHLLPLSLSTPGNAVKLSYNGVKTSLNISRFRTDFHPTKVVASGKDVVQHIRHAVIQV
jgi:hypothetical protein